MSTTTVPEEGDKHEQIVTPWDVQGSVAEDGKQQAIDYDKLVRQFGTRRLDESILSRFEKLTGHKPHVFLRRGLFFSHRCVAFLFEKEGGEDRCVASCKLIDDSSASLTRFSTDTSKANRFSCTQDGDRAAIACI
jgi:hypothetical protein